MDDERAQVLIALFGDSPEESAVSGAEFSGGDTEPGGEVAPGGEVMGRAGAGDQGGAGEQSDTVDLAQPSDVIAVHGELMELMLDALDALFEREDLVEQGGESSAQRVRQDTIIEDDTHLAFGVGGALGDGVAELSEEAAKGVDTGGAGFLPLFADAVQLLELLLVDGAHGDGPNAFAAMGFEQRLGIDTVGLITPAIGFDVLGGDDDGAMPGIDGLAGPEVRGTAGFEQDGGGVLMSKE